MLFGCGIYEASAHGTGFRTADQRASSKYELLGQVLLQRSRPVSLAQDLGHWCWKPPRKVCDSRLQVQGLPSTTTIIFFVGFS